MTSTVSSLLQITMLVNGRSFNGSMRHLDGARRMRSIVGNASPFTEFLPIRFPHEETIYLFLISFFNRGICCHLVGPFVCFLAGVLESYRTVTVYVALTDHPLLNLLFQRGPVPITNFTVEALFDFELTFVDDVYDIVMYNTRFGDITTAFTFYGIDSLNYGPDSNTDFIHFIWQSFERFNFRKYAIALIPSENNCELPTMRCLRDNRANSEGWRDFGNCSECVLQYQDYMRPFSNCRAPAAPCSCNICNRQPPSLRDSALHTIFLQVVNISRFELTVYTTNDEYAYAVRSNRASVSALLPPEYPAACIQLKYDPANFALKFHTHCPGAGPWHANSKKLFTSIAEAITELVNHKDQFWCQYCCRGLFFSPSCFHHLN
jgi:hypothetical protein